MKTNYLLCGTALCGAFIITAAYAQTAAPPPAQYAAPSPGTPAKVQNRGTSKQGAGGTEEVIVTAQRRSTKLSRTPVAVVALSSAALSREGVRTERDLQSSVAGLTVRASATANQLNYAIRGQSVDAFSNSRPGVQPYVDEVAIPQGGGSSAFYDLQSVQVLKGPQGTLFGRNSTGGAVLFTTAKPTPDFGGYITTRAGDYGLVGTEGALNIPILADKIDLRLAGYYENRDGFQTNIANDSHPGTIRRDALRATLYTAISDDVHNTIVADYGHGGGSGAYVPYGAYAPGSTNGGTVLNSEISTLFSPNLGAAIGFPPAWGLYLAAHPGVYPDGLDAFEALQKARGPYTVDFNSLDSHEADNFLISDVFTYDISDNLQFKNVVGYVHSRAKDMSDVDGTPYTLEGFSIVDAATEVTEEAQLLGKAFNNKLTYVTGFYFANEDDVGNDAASVLDLSPVIPVTPDVVNANFSNRSYAGYAQGTYDLSDLVGIPGLGFTAGGRYTDETNTAQQTLGSVYYNVPGGHDLLTKTYQKISWTFGMQEQLNPEMLFYVVSRHSFRSGGFNTAAPPSAASSADGGELFYPEVATDVEVGAKYLGKVAGVPLSANFAVYNEWVDNAQRQAIVTVPTGLAALTGNVPQAEITGLEIDGQVTPLPWLTIGTAGSATDARFTQPSTSLLGVPTVFGPYADTPKFSGNLYGEASFPLPHDLAKLTVRAEEYAQSSFYFGSLANTTAPGVKIPGYAITNFRVGLDNIAGTKLSLAGYVRNAFDKQYFVGGLPEGAALSVNSAIPGEPRMFYVEASYKF